MLTTFKQSIFLFCVFTMVMTASYRPAEICGTKNCFTRSSVPWKRDIRAATRNLWQSLADKFSSALSNVAVHAQNVSSHDKNVPPRKVLGFQELCANLGNDTKVSEPDKSNQTGTSIGKTIKQAFKKIPVEWHFPGYRYCGPNTNLKLRLPRDDKGINMLDEACKDHDKSYMTHPDLESRIAIDRALVLKAYERMKAANATRGEKVAAGFVVTFMCAKLHVTTKVNRVFGRMKQKDK